jgi:hypothetical protein
MMKIKYCIALFPLTVGWLICADAGATAAQKNKIEIKAESGVADGAATSAEIAADHSLRFFKETFNLELQNEIRIIIVPNPEAYANVLIREGNINPKEAERRARTTIGWSIGDHLILQNAGAPFNPNPRRRIYNIGHEIVHKYQGQECANRCSRIMWIYEGAAGAIAAKVVELSGDRPLARQEASWLEEVRKMEKRPDLGELVSQSGWNRGLERHGSDPSYSLAALAVSHLIKGKGYEALFAYFKALNNVSPEESFKQAFGMDMKNYGIEFKAVLDRQLNPNGK